MLKILITISSFASKDSDCFIRLNKYYKTVLNPYGRRLTEDELIQMVDEKVVGIVAGLEPITAEVLNVSTGLKVISRCGVGLDNVDVNAAKARGIKVVNTPAIPTVAVAELTLALMLNLLRNIFLSANNLKQGLFVRSSGALLSGKTVGIIGCGQIGRKVIDLVQTFGAAVIVHDPYCQLFPPNVQVASLHELLSDADIISLHIPYSAGAHHLIGQKELALMKDTAILLNTARGGLIDEAALYESLKFKHLAGAAIDCFEQEPYSGPLSTLDNILLTPHIGGYTLETRVAMEIAAIENILKILTLEE